ncbi:MAG: Gfo/Idh/MocA family protein [Dehalococcoidia bacterium]
MTPVRIGLIGAGGNVRLRHAPGFHAIEGVELVSVANRTPESSAKAAAEYGARKVAESPYALIADPEVDAVCIGTWPYRHMEYTVAALEAGKHVLCEARMAMDLDEALTMQRAQEAHPELVAQLVPAPFDFRLGPTVTRLVGEGVLGDLVEVTVSVLNGSGLDPAAPAHWRHQVRYSGRNVMSFGIYVEVIERWLGLHASVRADGTVFIKERRDAETGSMVAIDVPDSYRVFARMESGVPLSYHFSTVTAGAPASGISIYGTKATLHWTADDRARLVPHGGTAEELTPDAGTDRGWQVEGDFVASIRTGAPVRLTSFDDGVAYMRVIDACWRSWRDGVEVRV